MFAKNRKVIINLAATERIQLSGERLEFYGLDGGMRHSVRFPTPEAAEKALRLLALELKAKGQLLIALEEGE